MSLEGLFAFVAYLLLVIVGCCWLFIVVYCLLLVIVCCWLFRLSNTPAFAAVIVGASGRVGHDAVVVAITVAGGAVVDDDGGSAVVVPVDFPLVFFNTATTQTAVVFENASA